MSTPLRVAVTGGSGRVGRGVVRELVDRGHTVLNLDRRPSPDNLARFCFVDVTQRAQVQPYLEQVDAVVHLAEIPHQQTPVSADTIFASNAAACSGVLQAAADLKLRRAIYTSSVQVYGCWDQPAVPPRHLPFDETHPVQPQNVYAISKVANELFAQFVAKHDGLSVAVFRMPWVVTGDLTDWWQRWFTTRADGRVDGLDTYVHVSDVARAYALAIENPRPGCEVYHISAPEVRGRDPIRRRLLEGNPDYPPLPEDWPDLKSPMLMDKLYGHFGFRPTWEFKAEFRRQFGKDPFDR